MLIQIKDIRPNPYRNIDVYPILRPKIDTLVASYEKTEYWDNILGRLNEKGEFEQAYGHHRWVALKEHYGEDHKVEVIVKKLSDAEMIQIMASENMEQWGTSAIVEIETIEAVVKAFAAGKIMLASPHKSCSVSELRYAPSFILGNEPPDKSVRSYNAQTVADFLGWTYGKNKQAADKVQIALTALQYMEEGLVELANFADMTSGGILAVIREARLARSYKESRAKEAERLAEARRKEAEEAKKEEERAQARKDAERAKQKRAEREEAERAEAYQRAEAKRLHKEGQKVASKVTKAVSAHIRSGGGTKTARDVAIKAAPLHQRQGEPDIEKALSAVLSKMWDFCLKDELPGKLKEILKFKASLDEDVLRNAQRTIRDVRDRMESWAKEFEPSKRKEKEAKDGKLLLRN